MKRFLTRCLVLGLAVLPAQVKAADPPKPAKDAGGVPAMVLSVEETAITRLPAPGKGGEAAVVLPADDKGCTPLLAPAKGCAPVSDCGPAPACDEHPAESSGNRFLAFADYLYWSVHGANVPYAQQFFGVDPATAVPRGPVEDVSPRYTNGARLGAGFGVCDNGWIVGTYTYFHDTNSSSVRAVDPFIIRSLLNFPNTVNAAATNLQANAQMTIDLQMGDIDYEWNFCHGDHLSLSFISGARYGHMDQKMLAAYQITGTTLINPLIYFDGGGPRTGLSGEYKISGGFYGYTKGMVSLLAGEFTGTYTQVNTFTGLVGNTTLRDDRIVPVTELEVGVGWCSSSGRVRLSAGYYVGSWFNTVTIGSFASSVQAVNFTRNASNNTDTMTFDGFVGKLELRF
jgi:hypothetical protein